MAFVIYNGTTSGNDTEDMNEILDKLIEMWDFDSVDQESERHSATYGNAMIRTSTQDGRFALELVDEAILIENLGYYNSNTYTIVKTDNAVMLALGAGSGTWDVWIIGKLTNIDGTTGKGIIGIVSGTGAWYAVLGDSTQANVTDTLRSSQDIAQLVPYVSTQGGWYFDNAYRLLIGLNNTLKGKYQIGEDVYYIAGRSAIKE
jgi:hypothetical protein